MCDGNLLWEDYQTDSITEWIYPIHYVWDLAGATWQKSLCVITVMLSGVITVSEDKKQFLCPFMAFCFPLRVWLQEWVTVLAKTHTSASQHSLLPKWVVKSHKSMKGGIYLIHECALKAVKDTASQQGLHMGNNRRRHHHKGPADLRRFICNPFKKLKKQNFHWMETGGGYSEVGKKTESWGAESREEAVWEDSF